MFRPSGSIVLSFWIKKASLALRMESRLEKIFSMGINIMSLTVWLGEDRKCSAAVVGLEKEMFRKSTLFCLLCLRSWATRTCHNLRRWSYQICLRQNYLSVSNLSSVARLYEGCKSVVVSSWRTLSWFDELTTFKLFAQRSRLGF